MSGRLVSLTFWVVAAMLAGCAAREPVLMPAQYQPTADTVAAERVQRGAPTTCLVRIAEIRDQRTDPHSLGETGSQPVRTENSADWIGSALRSLDGASGLTFVDRPQADGAELVMTIDLLRAYAMNVNTNRIVSVVIRVRFSRRGAPLDERIYRGGETAVNWSAGARETGDALNRALGDLLEPVRKDILSRCRAA